MVQLLIKLVQLRRLGHHILPHHERRLNTPVIAFAEELETVVDQGLVEVHAGVGEEEAAVAGDLHAYRRTPPRPLFSYGLETLCKRAVYSPRSVSYASNLPNTS